MFRDKFEIDKIDNVIIAKPNGIPFLARLIFVITVSLSIRRPADLSDRDIIHLRPKSVMQGYIHPGIAMQAHINDCRRRYVCPVGYEEYDGQLVIRDLPFPDYYDFLLRNMIEFPDSQMEFTDAIFVGAKSNINVS
jgi:hypothetical protein